MSQNTTDILRAIKFTTDDAQRAVDEWGFNCGPAALCAVLGMTPDELRPHLLDFESKRYTNPTLMADVLRGLNVPFRRRFECPVQVDGRPLPRDWPTFGLVRVQWGGPWTKEGVPMRARYRHTHWIGFANENQDGSQGMVFDINAMCAGGWITLYEWASQLVPWLIREAVPKGDGTWWPTHCWEIEQ